MLVFIKQYTDNHLVLENIFKNQKSDFLFIFFPFLISLSLPFFTYTGTKYYFIFLICVAIIDSGHVYITMWRTWFNPYLKPFPIKFTLIPLLILVLITTWNYLEFKGLWSFVVYFTVYHNIRQFYGLSRWYQHKYKSEKNYSNIFLYLICYTSFLAFHFRNNLTFQYYASEELFIFPNEIIFNLLKTILWAMLTAFVIYEVIYGIQKSKIEINRIVLLILIKSTYIVAFLFSSNELELIAPLILTHGLHYFALTIYAITKTKTQFTNKLYKASIVVGIFMIFAGSMEYFFENYFLDTNNFTFLHSVLIASYLVPLLSHFLYDAIIWKKNYFEFNELISTTMDNTPQNQ